MRLHAQGWRSEYVPAAAGHRRGAGHLEGLLQPADALGLRLHGRPAASTRGPLTSRMPWRWRALYLSLQQGYFSGLVGAVGCVLLVAYFLGGVEISRLDAGRSS